MSAIPNDGYDISKIIAEVDDRGFSIIPSVISPEKADETRGVLEKHLASESTRATVQAKSQRVQKIAVKDPLFVELMSHPLIVSIWRAYLDKDVIYSSWTANTSFPGFDKFLWHPDFPYGIMRQPWPGDHISGQTIWLLDDFTDENGGTGVLPYSQRKGYPPPSEMVGEWHSDGVVLTGVRGSVMVMHGATWHTARPNSTDKPRSALLGMYTRPFYLTQVDMRDQLRDLKNPPEIVRQLMGENQYQPVLGE